MKFELNISQFLHQKYRELTANKDRSIVVHASAGGTYLYEIGPTLASMVCDWDALNAHASAAAMNRYQETLFHSAMGGELVNE